jgi:thiol-disulfide isomerase/thioredoxin
VAWVEVHREGGGALKDLLQKELVAANKAKQSVVIMFTADWCTPCKAIKDWLHESPAVQKAAKKGRILLIDVDEWRGPAHSLLPGINPTKLPQLVRLDPKGDVSVSCYGTDLGIMSEQSMARNLARLIDGKAPEKPVYEKDPAELRKLAVADVERNRAKTKDLAPLDVKVLSRQEGQGGLVRWSLQLGIRNKDSARKWFAVSGRLGEALSEAPKVTGYKVQRWNDHVRAYAMQMQGTPPFTLIPVAGWGSVDLKGFIVEGPASASTLEIWELSRATVDGQQLQFDKKVPYQLTIEAAFLTTPIFERSTPAEVRLYPGARHQIVLSE